jgi:uncharacterized surface protein with fasciclin (FAS1) repeats
MSSRNSNPFSDSLEVTDPEEISSESESFESEEDESLSSESEGTSSDDSDDDDDDDSNDEDRDISDDESDSEDDDDDSSSSSSSGDSSDSEFDEEDNIDKEAFYDEDGKRLNRSRSPTSFGDRIKKIHIILLSIGCLLFLVIVIALGVGLGLKGDKEDASTSPASAPSPSITFRPTRQGEPTKISLNDDDSNGDIPGTAVDAGIFNTLVAALGAADLVDALSEPNGPYTVFAPTDDAFAALPEELVPCLLRSKNKGALTNILLYHVVDGQVLSTDLSNGLEAPTLLEGEDVTIDLTDGVKINDSTVIKADVLTSNGVIHVVDAVLVPPSIDVAAFLSTCDVPARGDVELTVVSNADTTIYRDGLFQDSVNGNDNTMLIQNGPPGDLELASAYSLVELSFNANKIENLKNANAEFCLDHVINDKPADRVITYSTCLLIPLSDGSVDAMIGATSSYVMPDDCVGNKVVDFDVRPFDTTICVDVTPLLFGSNDRTIRRSLQEEKSLIMMIDNLVESDEPGDRFYTSNDETKSPPTLVIEGKGTVQDIDDNIDDDDDDDDDDDNNEEECQTIGMYLKNYCR